MPTTRKQKKARKSRGWKILWDIENLDIMLSERHSEREESANGNSARRPERVTNDMFENNAESVYLNNAEARPGVSTSQDQNSAGVNSNAEINKLSGEFNSRLSRETDDMMNSGNSQIQRAVSDAISNQKMPQIQNALKARSGHLTQNRWNVPAERPELNSEDCRSERIKGNLRSEPVRTCFVENHHEQAYVRHCDRRKRTSNPSSRVSHRTNPIAKSSQSTRRRT